MTDQIVSDPVQQSTDTGQQSDPNPAATPPASTPTGPNVPAGISPGNWEARYKGAVAKIEELTLANRNLQTQQQVQASEIERLNTALATKDVEKTVAVGERDKNLENVLTRNQELEVELTQLRAYKLKVETARELGHPELVHILGSIPDIGDAEVLKGVMTDFIKFRQDGIKEREAVLLSGYTPPVPNVQTTQTLPTTAKGWESHLDQLPLGSPERQKAFDQYFEWTQQ